MVKWLVVGIGDISRKRVIPAILAEPRSSLYGVVTRDVKKAEAYPGALAWPTLEEALQDPAGAIVDAVYVASPVLLHAQQTIAALQAGKPVLREKPVAMNIAEAKSMLDAAETSGRLFGVSSYRRLYPKLVRAKDLIAVGVIGQPLLAEANYHGWLESDDRAWLRDPAMAGAGPLFDVGSHRIDAMNFLFGKPLRATGLLSNALHQMGVEDSATVLMEYANGIHGVVDARWNSRVPRDQFRVIGTDGEIVLDPLNGPELRVGGRVELLPTHANVHYPLIENFASAVLDGAPLACPGDQAIWVDWVSQIVKDSSAHPAYG